MTTAQIIEKLLQDRGLVTPQLVADFFSPPHPSTLPSPFDSSPAIQLIKQHIGQNNRIAIFGDYDVDGVCSTAILWETLYQLSSEVFPYIPNRRDEGYGISISGVDACISQGAKLIIAVDNGIVANSAIQYCRDHNCDVIIIDHHETDGHLPPANVILHSTSTCAACLVWFFCRDLTVNNLSPDHLGFAGMAAICDMVPLLGVNRSFAYHGIAALRSSSRPGLLALTTLAGFPLTEIDAYKIGFVVGPRLNAMGRLEHALDSLRLLCTLNPQRAQDLAFLLTETNTSRQSLTSLAIDHALSQISDPLPQLVAIAHSSYDEGVIGLVASKIVEKYYRPTIIISVGDSLAKGSCRSIAGFHITDHLRQYSHLLKGVGGHAMAAGFSLEPKNLPEFISQVTQINLASDLLVKKTRVDAQIDIVDINSQLYDQLQQFAPFGLGNPHPVFSSSVSTIGSPKRIGQDGKHLKFTAQNFEAIYFNAPQECDVSHITSLHYQIGQNTFNGRTNLQLVVKNALT